MTRARDRRVRKLMDEYTASGTHGRDGSPAETDEGERFVGTVGI